MNILRSPLQSPLGSPLRSVFGVYNPMDEPGFQAYWDAETATVSEWRDLGPNGYRVSQSDPLKQPTIVDGIYGKEVNFAAGQSMITTGVNPGATDGSPIFAIADVNVPSAAASRTIFVVNADDGVSGSWLLRIRNTGAVITRYGLDTATGPAAALDGDGIASMYSDGSIVTATLDNVDGTDIAAAQSLGPLKDWFMGSNAGDGMPLLGSIRRLLLFFDDDPAMRQRVYDWIIEKRG